VRPKERERDEGIKLLFDLEPEKSHEIKWERGKEGESPLIDERRRDEKKPKQNGEKEPFFRGGGPQQQTTKES